ncbi:diacylglycerol kinase family enzyme [Acinetobacter calcoaceticus]|uniref:Diacylglycerol kinase family enzyme n=1 Tax=Acinetobacter calcoaceticus TaxID=471 RepID=A0A4R1Y1B1_ACICA|nr:diacylglycerol kinase family enzyme [Acinetobacter calcoaceticus]
MQQIIEYWQSQGFEVQRFEFSNADHIQELFKEILKRHTDPDRLGVIVAAGGDGTLNAVASQLCHLDIPMGILPLGTFNYVARLLKIPLDLNAAAEVIAQGQPREVHVGCINDRIYLNNASLGLYPLFIRKREEYNQKFGRFPLHAYTSGLDVLLRDRKALKLEVAVDQQRYRIKTPLVFFGNNQLQLAEMKLKVAKCAEIGQVVGVVMAKSDKLTLFKALFQLIKGDLEHAADVYSFSAEQVMVYSKKASLTVAIDGEIVELATPLKIRVEKNALKIMVPYADSSV